MDAVEEIKSRLAIEDVIGSYVQLKRAGRNWKGLSPFSSEHTPSFVVSPEKQIWHDFSSGKGGDMFSFVMEMEGLDFRGSLELLARKAGVDLEQYRGSSEQGNAKQKERLYKLLDLTTRFYQTQLKSNTAALEYVFKKRQFSKETVLEWQLGYAPNNGNALVTFLKGKKYTEQEIRDAGLSSRNYRGGMQDMFRGRIMVPLTDAQGRVIGFTARLLGDATDAPKYINTPATLLYDKSRHVFGLHLAKEAIRKLKYVVIAEGNLDVIMSHQAGVRQVVATAGTALTEQQLKALGRFTPDVRLSFDADKAGISATERAIPIASKVGISLGIIDIPSGKDPDELIKQNSALWQSAISKPKYALDWLIDRYVGLLDLTSAQGKRNFSDVLLPIIRQLSDSVEQDHYLNKIAKLMDVSREALLNKFEKTPAETPVLKRVKAPVQVLDKRVVELVKVQNHLLAVVLMNPTLRSFLENIEADMFSDNRARKLFELLTRNPDFSGKAEDLAKLASTQSEQVQILVEYAKILTLQYEELYQGLELLELRYEAARLQENVTKRFIETEKQKLAAQLDTADDTKRQSLQERDKHLNVLRGRAEQLLMQARGGENG